MPLVSFFLLFQVIRERREILEKTEHKVNIENGKTIIKIEIIIN